jgi:lipid II:glycine glycyltransferase (peptidoglycan interpeptide bridge formation enzyme)
MQTREITSGSAWDGLIARHPQAHPLQLWGWGEVKREAGWIPWRVAVTGHDGELRAAAQVLVRRVPRVPLCMLYIPRGPVVAPDDIQALEEMMIAIGGYGRSVGAIFCKIDPPWLVGTTHALADAQFHPSTAGVQATETFTIDLTKSEDDLFGAMRSKTRQYIRKAEREAIEIVRDTTGEWLPACYEIFRETAQRAQFGLHPRSYYDAIFRLCDPERHYLYIARREGQPLAFLWMACAGRFAVELYGGVSDAGQEYKSNYLLKWHAIREMRADGYQVYDLNGRVNDGISQFKQGFGPDEAAWIGPFDRVYHPLMYQAWTRALPLARRFLSRDAGAAVGA